MNRLKLGLWAVGLLAVQAGVASAGWNNVFQTTLHNPGTNQVQFTTASHLKSGPVVGTLVCNNCQQPGAQCTTNYQQRCCYQPVTTMQTQCNYEPVTTMQTSYYYEPCTSYRYSMYVDPCTGCSQQVAVPVTSYVLRAQSCPVQSWVQRCSSVPVTSYQKSCYWEQQTCCTQPVAGPGAPTAPLVPTAPPAAPIAPLAPPINPNVPPGGPPTAPTAPPPMSGPYGARFSPPGNAMPASKPASPPTVKFERIVVGPDSRVDGVVVRSDNAPRANANLVFVNAQNQAQRQMATTNTAGRFQVPLSTGTWWVYMQTSNGTHAYNSTINVNGQQQAAQVKLVSR